LTAGAVVAVATSQSRSSVLAAIVGVIAFAALATAGRQALKALAAVVMLGLVATLAISEVDKGGSFNRYESIAPNRVVATTLNARRGTYQGIGDYFTHFPLGAGIGSVGPAAAVIDPPPLKYLDAESQVTFLIIELGVPGLLLLAAFHLRLIGLIVRRIRRIVSGELRLLLAGVGAPLFALLSLWVVGVNTTSTPNAPYLWFMAGTLAYWLCGPGQKAGATADPSARDAAARA
jgi:O-antigen ligase